MGGLWNWWRGSFVTLSGLILGMWADSDGGESHGLDKDVWGLLAVAVLQAPMRIFLPSRKGFDVVGISQGPG